MRWSGWASAFRADQGQTLTANQLDGGDRAAYHVWIMARPPRIDFPDALYHVTSRGNGRQQIFWTNDDRQRFVGQLSDGVNSAAIVLYAFAIMDNHILCGA
jgi:hypothetical protein